MSGLGDLMGARYSFETIWKVDAPVERVWEAISHPLEWPQWWKGVVAVKELEPGDADGMGALHRYSWKSALPYRLDFDMRVTEVDEPLRLEGTADGELRGTGTWNFEPNGAKTVVRYNWDIETTRRWMNALAPLLRPAFEWNHDWVMRSGGKGLGELLGTHVEHIEAPKERPWLKPVVIGAVVTFVLLRRRRKRTK
jgi:uncharacterized protein YndB with AHSA1/START domain